MLAWRARKEVVKAVVGKGGKREGKGEGGWENRDAKTNRLGSTVGGKGTQRGDEGSTPASGDAGSSEKREIGKSGLSRLRRGGGPTGGTHKSAFAVAVAVASGSATSFRRTRTGRTCQTTVVLVHAHAHAHVAAVVLPRRGAQVPRRWTAVGSSPATRWPNREADAVDRAARCRCCSEMAESSFQMLRRFGSGTTDRASRSSAHVPVDPSRSLPAWAHTHSSGR